MNRIPTRTHGRFVRRYATRYVGYITYSSGAVRLGVPCLPSVVASRPLRSTQRNAIRRIGGRVEPSTPPMVVGQSSGWHTSSAPEGDPLGFLSLRYPRPLEATLLVEGHDIAHGGGVYRAVVDKGGFAS
jgi:hypothetical protein